MWPKGHIDAQRWLRAQHVNAKATVLSQDPKDVPRDELEKLIVEFNGIV